jgi:hypothetical protein
MCCDQTGLPRARKRSHGVYALMGLEVFDFLVRCWKTFDVGLSGVLTYLLLSAFSFSFQAYHIKKNTNNHTLTCKRISDERGSFDDFLSLRWGEINFKKGVVEKH